MKRKGIEGEEGEKRELVMVLSCGDGVFVLMEDDIQREEEEAVAEFTSTKKRHQKQKLFFVKISYLFCAI